MSNKFDKTARLYRQVSELVKQINKIPTIKKQPALIERYLNQQMEEYPKFNYIPQTYPRKQKSDRQQFKRKDVRIAQATNQLCKSLSFLTMEQFKELIKQMQLHEIQQYRETFQILISSMKSLQKQSQIQQKYILDSYQQLLSMLQNLLAVPTASNDKPDYL